jgi:uncharacterized protein YaaN involved in tellurite resistance
MQQFQDDIMKNRLMLEKLNKELTERISRLEQRLHILERLLNAGTEDPEINSGDGLN